MSHSAELNGTNRVAVVGGGLAGLTAAIVAARRGSRVTLYEARREYGGRARTENAEGFLFNQGAHALYRAGAALPILSEFGVKVGGRVPLQRGFQWINGGQTIPKRRLSAVGGLAGLNLARRMIGRDSASSARGQLMSEWLDQNTDESTRPFAEMLVRTTCYAVDFEHTDAEACLIQLRRGARGVLYLHGGWQSLVDQLADRAKSDGVTFHQQRVMKVTPTGGGATLAFEDGESRKYEAAVLAAGGAHHADRLLDGSSATVAAWAEAARPVKASALDVSLRPAGRPLSAYGLGQPTYFVDHSTTAKVAPKGSSLIHCLWYEPDLTPDCDHRAKLEAGLDLLQPDWRERVIEASWSRRLVVAHDRPQPGGHDSQPTVTIDDSPAVFVAGDWITADGLLADAAVSSGRAAGLAAVRLESVVASIPQ